MRIVLDPGHGQGYNKGVLDGYAEGTAMWHYANILADKLREKGMEAVITRPNITDNPSLAKRGRMAAGADMFLSLHSNAAAAESAHGVSVFSSIRREDKVLAGKFSGRLAEVIGGGTRDRGAQTRKSGKGDWDYYTVIQSAAETDCPHILLIEHGFHTNPAECAWLMEEDNLRVMADLETEIILDALGADKLEQGWVQGEDKRWQYYAPDGGLLCTQWLLYNGSWYRLMEDGTMAEGWAKVGGKWYYLTPGKGAMVTGRQVIDGVAYEFDVEGWMV